MDISIFSFFSGWFRINSSVFRQADRLSVAKGDDFLRLCEAVGGVMSFT
jgi:hypothetical protein